MSETAPSSRPNQCAASELHHEFTYTFTHEGSKASLNRGTQVLPCNYLLPNGNTCPYSGRIAPGGEITKHDETGKEVTICPDLEASLGTIQAMELRHAMRIRGSREPSYRVLRFTSYPHVTEDYRPGIKLYGHLHDPGETDTVLAFNHGWAGRAFLNEFLDEAIKSLAAARIAFFTYDSVGANEGTWFGNQKVGGGKRDFAHSVSHIGSVMQALRKEGFERVILGGFSMGGSEVVNYQTSGKDFSLTPRLIGNVLFNLTNLPEWFRSSDPNIASLLRKAEAAIAAGNPEEEVGTHEAFEMPVVAAMIKSVTEREGPADAYRMEKLGSLAVPTLILAGGEDQTIRSTFGNLTAWEQQIRSFNNHQLRPVIVRGADHGIENRDAQRTVAAKTAEFASEVMATMTQTRLGQATLLRETQLVHDRLIRESSIVGLINDIRVSKPDSEELLVAFEDKPRFTKNVQGGSPIRQTEIGISIISPKAWQIIRLAGVTTFSDGREIVTPIMFKEGSLTDTQTSLLLAMVASLTDRRTGRNNQAQTLPDLSLHLENIRGLHKAEKP